MFTRRAIYIVIADWLMYFLLCSSFANITFVVPEITFKVAVITSPVVKIIFEVAEIIFKVAVITSSVDKISLFIAKIAFVVAGITFKVCAHFFSGQDQFCIGRDNF